MDASNGSFLFFLHERGLFSKEAFEELCDAVEQFAGKPDTDTVVMVSRIYQEILKHLLYHFDPNDLSTIKDLPADYPEYMERLDQAVQKLYAFAESEE